MRRLGILLGSAAVSFLVMSAVSAAKAACTLPNQLTNGQATDATQVMANFNSAAACAADADNITSGSLPAAQMSTNLSAALDSALGSTQGSVLYRGASGWSALAPGTNGYVLSTNGPGANPSWVAPSGGSGGDFALVASVNPGTVNNFVITGLDTLNYDYRLAIRLGPRASEGASADYIQVQFGDTTLPTPTWFTTTTFVNATGSLNGNLKSSSGVTNIAQVQNNSTLYMGVNIDFQFSSDGLMVSALTHSYFWENIMQIDQEPNPSAIGAIKVTMPNQSWPVSYSLWKIRR